MLFRHQTNVIYTERNRVNRSQSGTNRPQVLLWPPYGIAAIIFSSCGFFLLLWPPCVADADISCPVVSFYLSIFCPRLISAVEEWMSGILPHMVCLIANLGCRSETCCTRLAGNDAQNRHLRTIVQLCRAVSSQLRHVSTIGKKLVKQQ